MGVFRDILWQRQSARLNNDVERKVTFLELFYDLVFVICISQIAHPLVSHPTFLALGQYAFLFIPIFWAWIGGSIYYDLHGTADLKTRLYTFVQMMLIAAITIYAEEAFDLSRRVFPLILAAQFLFMILLNWRTAVHHPRLRMFYYPFIVQTLIAVLLLSLSALVDSGWRYLFWGVGFLVIISGASITYAVRKGSIPRFQLSSSLRERFGLFTIIVIGEMLFEMIGTIRQIEPLSARVLLLAVVAVVMAVSVWWVYFDYLGFGRVRAGTMMRWNIGHAILAMNIPVFGAGISKVIRHHEVEHMSLLSVTMLSGSVIFILAGSKLIMSIIERQKKWDRLYRKGQRALSATLLVTVLLASLRYYGAYGELEYLLLTAASLLIPVVIGVQIWVSMMQATRAD